jgi:hypothetical protein
VEEVERLGRPVKYVKPSEDKEAIARRIVAEQKIGSGPVCVIKSVEAWKTAIDWEPRHRVFLDHSLAIEFRPLPHTSIANQIEHKQSTRVGSSKLILA